MTERPILLPPSGTLEQALNGLPERLLTAREMCAMLGIARMSLDRYERGDPRFPRRLYLSPRKVAWRLTEVSRWLEDKAGERGFVAGPTGARPGH